MFLSKLITHSAKSSIISIILLLSNGCVPALVGFELTALLYQHPPEIHKSIVKAKQKAVAIKVKDIMCKSFPGELKDWILIPRDNCSFETNYDLLTLIDQEYYYRRADGSDNIIIKSFINPPKQGIYWFYGMAFLPDSAEKLELGEGIQAWIHEEYLWDSFLASYDKNRDRGKCSVASLYIGDWHLESEFQNEINQLRNEDRRHKVFNIMYGKEYPELKPSSGVLNPELLPQSILEPLLYVNSSKAVRPSSMPNSSSPSIYPHCIAIRVVGKDRAVVMQMIGLINLKNILNLTKSK